MARASRVRRSEVCSPQPQECPEAFFSEMGMRSGDSLIGCSSGSDGFIIVGRAGVASLGGVPAAAAPTTLLPVDGG
ncbi:hypothetical protein MANAM107_04360 [Actinomyces capricornis]|uniref:Uncharacterized protein n=1 Tax=Actinomyces capricornis TaxID=2755559 RepID=A0ABN6K1W9_9ACTO|nr:hypothetical protein MANAM107_04360 [Actinomyces capricornis]